MTSCKVTHCNNTDATHELIYNSDGTVPICVDCLTNTDKTTTWEIRF